MPYDDEHCLVINNKKFYATKLVVVKETGGIIYEFESPRDLYEYIEGVYELKRKLVEKAKEIQELVNYKTEIVEDLVKQKTEIK